MSGPAENIFDVIVIGAGPVGYTVADRTRGAGLSVAVVERELPDRGWRSTTPSRTVSIDQAAACWLAAAGRFAYTANGDCGSIGRYAIAPDSIGAS